MQQRHIVIVGATLAALVWPLPSAAIYKCTDPKTGQVTYRDAACPSTSKDPQILRNGGAAVPVVAASAPASAASAGVATSK